MKKIKKMLVMLILTVITVSAVIPAQFSTVEAAKKKTVSIKITKKKVTLQKGKKTTLKTKINGKPKKKCKIIWSSSNKKVAKVSSKGVVKGLKKGKATITAKIKGTKKKATCNITVKEPKKIVPKKAESKKVVKSTTPKKTAVKKVATAKTTIQTTSANSKTVNKETTVTNVSEKSNTTKVENTPTQVIIKKTEEKADLTMVKRESIRYQFSYCPLYGYFVAEPEFQVRIKLKGSNTYAYLGRENPVYKVNGKIIAEWKEEKEDCKRYQTVTVSEDVIGEFHPIVYDKKKIEKKHSNRLSSERVYVSIYVGKKYYKSYDIPSTSGNMWDVCEYDSSTLVWEDIGETRYIPDASMIWFDDEYDGIAIKGFNYNDSVSEAHIYGNTIDVETTKDNYTDCIPYINPIIEKAGVTAKVEKNKNGRYCMNLYNQGKCCRTYNLNFSEYKGEFGLAGFRINGVIENYIFKDNCYCLTAKVGNKLLNDKYIEPILTQKDSTYKISEGDYILYNGEATRRLLVYGADGEFRQYTLAVFHSTTDGEETDIDDDYNDENNDEYDNEIDDGYDDEYDNEIDDDGYDDEYDNETDDDGYDDEYDNEIDDDDYYGETDDNYDDEYDDNYDESDEVDSDYDDEEDSIYGEFPNYRTITDNGDARIDKLQRSDGKAIKYEIVKYFKDYFEIYITSVEDNIADVCKNLVLTCANIERCLLWKGTNNEDWEFNLEKPGSMHLVTCKIYYAKMGTGVEPEEMYRMSRDITDDGPMRIVKMRRKDGKMLNYNMVQRSKYTCDLYISSVDALFETVYEQLLMVRANADECGVCPGEGNDDWSYVLIDNTTEKDMVYRIHYTQITK